MSLDLTVVIPAFNAAGTLAEQLEALSQQTFEGSWEVLVCDNGSTDDTSAVVAAFATRVPGLRRVDASQRRGPSHARNRGAHEAQGSLLLFCDADDIATPTWVAEMAAGLSRADAVAGSGEYARLNTHYADHGEIVPPLWGLPALPGMPAASSQNLGVRAQVFADIDGFDEALSVGEDADLCWRLQLAGHELAAQPDAIMHVRDRQTLRAIWRQAYQWGAAEKQLTHRYAAVREAQPAAAAPAPPTQDTAGAPDAGRAVRALARVRRPQDLTYVTRRFGRRAGVRWGRLDPSIPQVAPSESHARPREAGE